MIRRSLLLASALLAAIGLSGCKEEPAAPQATTTPAAGTPAAEIFQWKMVTAWPKNYPGLGTAANRLVNAIPWLTAAAPGLYDGLDVPLTPAHGRIGRSTA